MHRLLPILEDFWNFLTTLFLAILLYLSPIKHFIHLVAALIIIDFSMGIFSSFRLNIAITARRMVKTVHKLILYSIAIISTYLVQMIAGEDGIGLVRVCAFMIGATELKSIYDHVGKVIGGDLFSQLWQVVKSRLDHSTNKNKFQEEDNG